MSCVLVASLALEAPMSSGLICKLYFIKQFVFVFSLSNIFPNVGKNFKMYIFFFVKLN